MRATGAPHPDRIDSIKSTLDIKEKEDYILQLMSDTCEARRTPDPQGAEMTFEDCLKRLVAADLAIAKYYCPAFSNFVARNTEEKNFRYELRIIDDNNQILAITFGREKEELVLSLCCHGQNPFITAVATHAIKGEAVKIKGGLVKLPDWLEEEQKRHPEQLILVTSNNAWITLEYMERRIPIDGKVVTVKNPGYRVEPLPTSSAAATKTTAGGTAAS